MNWNQRIKEARERGEFTADDIEKSEDWVTCACGEQDSAIPRNTLSGSPQDAKLRSYGISFMFAVEEDDFDDAERLLGLIHNRAVELLEPGLPSMAEMPHVE